jgi:hypothetical protein
MFSIYVSLYQRYEKKDIKICLSYFIVPNKILRILLYQIKLAEERRAKSEERRANRETDKNLKNSNFLVK